MDRGHTLLVFSSQNPFFLLVDKSTWFLIMLQNSKFRLASYFSNGWY